MSQNDLSIANQGFASFRSDLNSALQALGSTNSGTSAPSTTYANQLFYDTSNNILKIRNEDNDAFISLLTLDQTNDRIESIVSTGNFTIDVAGDIILDADDGDIQFKNGGTLFGSINSDASSPQAMRIQSHVSNGDIVFKGNDGGSTITALTLDMSEAGQAIFTGTTTINTFLELKTYDDQANKWVLFTDTNDALSFNYNGAGNAEVVVNSSGKVGIGTASPSVLLDLESTDPKIRLTDSDATGTPECEISGGGGDLTLRADRDNEKSSSIIAFEVDGSEALRIDSTGRFILGKTSFDSSVVGFQVGDGGRGFFTTSTEECCNMNRKGDDGALLKFQQDGTTEGNISVSGSSVTLNGFSGQHESSGIATDTPVGTVVSTIDELDVYSAKQGEAGEQSDSPKAGQTRADHAKVEVSNTVGDKAVYGVVANFNAQGKVNVTSAGIGSVRVTGACEKGDLLESNGDGTAKVQSDDIVRSKTIGKVTIGNSNTGVKLVSCVLYCG